MKYVRFEVRQLNSIEASIVLRDWLNKPIFNCIISVDSAKQLKTHLLSIGYVISDIGLLNTTFNAFRKEKPHP
jgi:hypothetical protein